MGQVAVSIKIVPESDTRDVIEKIKLLEGIKEVNEELLGFGLKFIKVLAIIPDSKGGTEQIEKKLKKIQGVKRVEVEDVSLI